LEQPPEQGVGWAGRARYSAEGVAAPDKAVFREVAANQRWYRV